MAANIPGGVARSPRWHVLGERELYQDPALTLVKVHLKPPSGRPVEQYVVRLPHVVAVAVRDDKDRVLMVWRHRFIGDDWRWELPGGVVDDGEDGATAARREVEEETGWRPGTLTHLMTFQPMMGYVDCLHSLFVGIKPVRVGPPTDPDEVGTVDWISPRRVRELVLRDQVRGAGTFAALLQLASGWRPPRGHPEALESPGETSG